MVIEEKWRLNRSFIEAGFFLFVFPAMPFSGARRHRSATKESTPPACAFLSLGSGGRDSTESNSDPQQEREYAASLERVDRLWCKPKSATSQQQLDAANEVAMRWKVLW